MKIQAMLEKLQFKKLSPIQEKVIKNFDKPLNLVGLAPTGTGKTHAYLLPLLASLKRDSKTLQAIILVPTNELVMQVSSMLKATDDTVTSKAVYGSMDLEKEAASITKNPPHILITTPAKLDQLRTKFNAVNLKYVDYFILDEADMMFDEDFMNLIDRVLEDQEIKKFLLFSATITKQMEPFIKRYFGQYELIDTTKDSELKIKYRLIKVRSHRLETLNDITKVINPYLALIFVTKNEMIKEVYDSLLDQGLNVVSISSLIPVKQRKKILDDIHNLKYQYVVASDLIARGIDFKASHVIHYDLPYHLEFFKHRSGRTGRMGDTGEVITIYDEDDRSKIDKLRNKGIPFIPYAVTSDGFKTLERKSKTYDKEIASEIKKIKKPTKVAPNYKKKYAEKVKSAIKKVKKGRYKHANHR